MELNFLPLLPVELIVLICLILLAALALGSRILRKKQVPGRWVAYLGGLRLLAIILLALALLRPIMSWQTPQTRGPQLMVMVDTSASMGAPGSTTSNANGEGAAAPQAVSDDAHLRRAVNDLTSSGLSDQLTEGFDVSYFAFDRDARPVEPGNLADLAPTGETTRLGEAMRTAYTYQQFASDAGKRSLSATPPPGRVLLVSDGHDQSAEDAAAVARELGVKVYVLPAGVATEADARPRVDVVALQGPRRVLVGSALRFTATLRQQGAAEQPLNLELLEDGNVVASDSFAFPQGQTERQINLTHRPLSVGSRRYSLRVTPASGGAPLAGMQDYAMTVDVVGRAAEVLVLEDTWRWSFKYLRRVLEADPSFSFNAFLARGPGIYLQFAEPDSNVQLAGFPRSAAELAWFDVIVLGDVKPQFWADGVAPAIRQMVVDEGKSLVVIAGNNIARMADDPILSGLLPVEVDSSTARATPGPVNLRFTPEAATSSLFYTGGAPLTDSEGQPAGPWAELPPMDQLYVPVRKKPAASVLVDAPDRSNSFGPAIVVAEHAVGRGRVIYVGTDTLWKWHMLGSTDDNQDTAYTLFWQQALRSIAPRTDNRGNVVLDMQPSRSRFTTGQQVDVAIRVQSETPLEQSVVKADVTLPDGRIAPLSLLPEPGEAGVYTTSFEAGAPGMYELRSEVISAGASLAQATARLDAESGAAETPDRPADMNRLRRLASQTGGQIVDPTNQQTWPTADASETIEVSQARTLDLWQTYIMMLLLVAVLSVDWLLRLLRGFV